MQSIWSLRGKLRNTFNPVGVKNMVFAAVVPNNQLITVFDDAETYGESHEEDDGATDEENDNEAFGEKGSIDMSADGDDPGRENDLAETDDEGESQEEEKKTESDLKKKAKYKYPVVIVQVILNDPLLS